MAEVPKNIPPIIVAPDFREVDNIRSIMSVLELIEPEDLGVKIPSWHNQDQELLSELTESNRFVVLETQIHNTAPKMKTAVESFLSRTVLPSAITVNPSNYRSPEGQRVLTEKIVPLAHDNNVLVIGYAEHDDLPHTDEHFQDRETKRLRDSARAGFDAFEIHAVTVDSDYFQNERIYIEREEGVSEPLLIASKLSENGDSMVPVEERAAHLINQRGVNSVYLGDSIMNAPDPAALIRSIISHIHSEK